MFNTYSFLKCNFFIYNAIIVLFCSISLPICVYVLEMVNLYLQIKKLNFHLLNISQYVFFFFFSFKLYLRGDFFFSFWLCYKNKRWIEQQPRDWNVNKKYALESRVRTKDIKVIVLVCSMSLLICVYVLEMVNKYQEIKNLHFLSPNVS